MSQKINFFLAFAIGYYIGQFKHGWKPLFVTLILMSLEFLFVTISINLYRNYLKTKWQSEDKIKS